ncbi:hypothetical protein BD560DRAFT_426639 [Blakeslea trispora]|nr:hypothetical protein BD560DRAFT_426639 [Blakeslea trispora]
MEIMNRHKIATYLPNWIIFVLFNCWRLTLAAVHYVDSISKSARCFFLSKLQQWIGQTDMLHHASIHYLNLKQFGYSCLSQINLIAYKKGDTNIIPDSLCPEVQTPAMSNTTTDPYLTVPKTQKDQKEGVTNNRLNNHATKNSSNENKQIIKSNSASLIQQSHKNTNDQDKLNVASFSPKVTTSMAHSDEWTLVKKSKKTPSDNTTYPSTDNKPCKKKKKRTNKKKCSRKQDQKLKTDTHPSWSCVAANAQPKLLEQDKPELSESDLPCLSDNDSITTSSSSSSPFFSSRHLPAPHFEEEEIASERTRYYSPFSTGFDFGVTLQQKHQPMLSKSTHSKSLLELLNQTDHVKTTITPTSFRYFDDMMMSTSLYKTYQEPELDPTMIKIKQDWDSISYCT